MCDSPIIPRSCLCCVVCAFLHLFRAECCACKVNEVCSRGIAAAASCAHVLSLGLDSDSLVVCVSLFRMPASECMRVSMS